MKMDQRELRRITKLCRELGIKRLTTDEYDVSFFKDEPPSKRARASRAAEEALDTGEPMPSDEELLYAATRFFQTEAERKASQLEDDKIEDRK